MQTTAVQNNARGLQSQMRRQMLVPDLYVLTLKFGFAYKKRQKREKKKSLRHICLLISGIIQQAKVRGVTAERKGDTYMETFFCQA